MALACFMWLPSHAQQRAELGINMLWIPGDAATLRERFRKARALGITKVRLDWEWRKAETRRGEYQWDKLDTLVQTAKEEGVSLLPIVHYAPAWALREEKKPADTYEMALREDTFGDYANFLLACIKRYGPNGNASVPFAPIKHWQVWNEPNIPQFWGPKPDPAAYTRLLQNVAAVVAPVRDKIDIVHAGISKADVEFLWQLWEANPRHGDNFDIFAVHPYIYDWSEGVREADAMDRDESAAAAMGFVGSVKDSAFLGKVFNLQLFMKLRGVHTKPIWITEMGYFVANHRLGVTEEEQGRRLGTTIEFVQRRLTDSPFGSGQRAMAANVQRLYWFSLEDYPSPEGLGSFGVYRPDGTLRPSGQLLQRLTR